MRPQASDSSDVSYSDLLLSATDLVAADDCPNSVPENQSTRPLGNARYGGLAVPLFVETKE
jgi:hypothetical protein